MDTRWSQVVAGLAAAAGGAAALLSLTTARGYAGRDPDLELVVTRSPETAVAAGIVISVVIAILASRVDCRAAAGVTALGLVGVALTVDSSMQSVHATIGTTAAAGVAMGGLVRWTQNSPGALVSLASGAVFGATVSFPLRHPEVVVVEGPRPQYALDTRSVGVALVIIAIVALVLATFVAGAESTATPMRVTGLVVALLLTGGAWALALWVATERADTGRYWGWLLVPLVATTAAVLRGRGGSSLLMIALGWAAATRPDDLSWIPDVRWLALLMPLCAVGVLLGRWYPRPEVGVALLIPCVATWLIIGGPMDRTFSFLALFVVPVLVVGALTAALRQRTDGPEIIAVTLTAVALWTTSPPRPVEIFVTQVGDAPAVEIGSYAIPQTLAIAAEYVVPAVLTLVLCISALAMLRRQVPHA